MSLQRKLEAAIAIIAPFADLRREAVHLAREAVRQDMERQTEDGVIYTTPHRARCWQWERTDGFVVPFGAPGWLECARCPLRAGDGPGGCRCEGLEVA